MFEAISARLSSLSSDLAALQAQVAQAERDAAIVAKLHEIAEALPTIHARMVVQPRGVVEFEVRDDEDQLIWWQYVQPFPDGLLKVDTTRWPTFEQIVRRWEVATPTPRAGNPFERSTWRSPGRLVPTEYNGRKAGEL